MYPFRLDTGVTSSILARSGAGPEIFMLLSSAAFDLTLVSGRYNVRYDLGIWDRLEDTLLGYQEQCRTSVLICNAA
jgi:hypothetical protein